MNEFFSKKKILRSLVFVALTLVFSKLYLELIPVSNIFYALEIPTTENGNSALAVYLIYMVLWIVLIMLAKKASCKIIPTNRKIGSNEDKTPKFKPQFIHWAIVGIVVIFAIISSAFLSFSNLTTNQTIIYFILGLFVCSIIVAFIKLYAVICTINESNARSENSNEK